MKTSYFFTWLNLNFIIFLGGGGNVIQLFIFSIKSILFALMRIPNPCIPYEPIIHSYFNLKKKGRASAHLAPIAFDTSVNVNIHQQSFNFLQLVSKFFKIRCTP